MLPTPCSHGQTDTCENITCPQLRLRVVTSLEDSWGRWKKLGCRDFWDDLIYLFKCVMFLTSAGTPSNFPNTASMPLTLDCWPMATWLNLWALPLAQIGYQISRAHWVCPPPPWTDKSKYILIFYIVAFLTFVQADNGKGKFTFSSGLTELDFLQRCPLTPQEKRALKNHTTGIAVQNENWICNWHFLPCWSILYRNLGIHLFTKKIQKKKHKTPKFSFTENRCWRN